MKKKYFIIVTIIMVVLFSFCVYSFIQVINTKQTIQIDYTMCINKKAKLEKIELVKTYGTKFRSDHYYLIYLQDEEDPYYVSPLLKKYFKNYQDFNKGDNLFIDVIENEDKDYKCEIVELQIKDQVIYNLEDYQSVHTTNRTVFLIVIPILAGVILFLYGAFLWLLKK